MIAALGIIPDRGRLACIAPGKRAPSIDGETFESVKFPIRLVWRVNRASFQQLKHDHKQALWGELHKYHIQTTREVNDSSVVAGMIDSSLAVVYKMNWI